MCGIVGIIGSPHSPMETFQGLQLLQHRGQDAAGILSFDFHRSRYSLHKDQGLVNQVFTDEALQKLKGQMSIGHTRYSTIGALDVKDVQPMILNYPFGLGLVHNGNLINFDELKEFLNTERKRFIFSNNDSEVLINLLSDHLAHTLKKFSPDKVDADLFFQAIKYLYQYAKGGYSVVTTVAPYGLLAFRDPHAIRPLVIGKRKMTPAEQEHSPFHGEYTYCVASESVVLDFLGYELERDLAPSEAVFIDKTGKVTYKKLDTTKKTACMFEWIYFSNPESILENLSVYQVRLSLGEKLGKSIKPMIESGEISPDYVVPVPDTSTISSMKLAEVLGIPLRPLLNKNRYVQRSFILNSQKSREDAVKLKLAPISGAIKGKNLLVVDDSIVRGTTSRRIVQLLKSHGANEVYFASTCPPITAPCGYGIDFPNQNDLIAYNRSEDTIQEHLSCEKVIYLSIDDLDDVLGTEICKGCLTAQYPVGKEYILGRSGRADREI